jgi:hypothetical protein
MEMAKLCKAMYILEKEGHPLFKMVENLVLGGLRDVGDKLSHEELYEIALSFNLTRTGSREFYKVLEYTLRNRMQEIGKDKQMARKLFEMYSRSALCSPSFIEEIEFFC